MDRKSIVVLVLSMVFLFSWQGLMNKWYPQKPKSAKAGGTNAPASTNLSATKPGSFGEVTTNLAPQSLGTTNTASTNNPAVAAAPSLAFAPAPAPPPEEELLVLDTELTRYTFTSLGGGIKLVELKKHPERVGRLAEFGAGRLTKLNEKAPVPIGALFIAGAVSENTPYTLSKTNGGVNAMLQFPDGSRIVKEFRPSTNYAMDVSVRFENHNPGTKINKPEHYFVTGTATLMNPRDDGFYVKFFWFDGEDRHTTDHRWFLNKTLGCFPGRPRTSYTAEEEALWSSVQNQFFTVTTIPEKPAPRVIAKEIEMPKYTAEELAPGERPKIKKPYAIQSGFAYKTNAIFPGVENALVHNYHMYIGPKVYGTFAKMATSQKNEIDRVMDLNGFIIIDGFFARALLLGMNSLHNQGMTYAWAIICITIIMKLLFWPLTNASTKSMKRMAELQPEMKKLQDKYKDDPQKMNRKMMEFWKENNVNPMGGCWPMLLQLPVFLGFFTMLRSAVELRGGQFLWVTDLAAPDTIGHLAGFPINILPILMGVTMFWQSSLTPASPGMDPTQQKIMRYLPLIFVVFLYNFASALTLYWTVQNLLSVLQTKITKSSDGKKKGDKPAPTKRDDGIIGKGPVKKRKNR
ncbi:MAG: hypothetical protein CMO80_16670 [Verrucomicrobiales bacterium]|nr:hypothetical protein [Verrucomicrobiales bacterium]|tara:strand:+ start:10002 stop:11894 length:1893 start_codon:yes stop_codon:yes gene_type:complete